MKREKMRGRYVFLGAAWRKDDHEYNRSMDTNSIDIYLETGQKRVFAGAVAWPGWCRSGRDEGSAIIALLDYGPRYARVLEGTSLGFEAPVEGTAFKIVERLKGNMTTDFGAPDGVPVADEASFGEEDFQQAKTLLEVFWQALDRAAQQAEGKELRKGPRGGGREADQIVRHVLEADASYLSKIGGKRKKGEDDNLEAEIARHVETVIVALEVAAREGVPATGPRGGSRWPARYFVRRSAWHVLDHVWEIEDRMM
jgi:hypothetical protein